MNESYAEAGCKRKEDAVTYLIRGGLILASIVLFLFGMQNQIFLFIAAIAIVAIFYTVWPRLKVEYEYVFCDGQLDFDKISGGQKRKTVKRIDFENVEMCAPTNSHALDGYTYAQVKVLDFTSKDKQAKTYSVVVNDNGTKLKIMFEPSQTMLDCIKAKAPRKIVFE